MQGKAPYSQGFCGNLLKKSRNMPTILLETQLVERRLRVQTPPETEDSSRFLLDSKLKIHYS